MPESFDTAPASDFDLTQLAERLVEHRLARAAGASTPAVLDIFRKAAGVLSLRVAIETRSPVSAMLATVTDGLVEAVGARLCRLIFADPSSDVFAVFRGDGSIGEEARLPALNGIAGQVFASGISRITDRLDSASDMDAASDLPAGETVMQSLCVAIRRRGEMTGILQLFDQIEGCFTEADCRLAEAAASHIAELAVRAGLVPRSGGSGSAGPLRLIEQAQVDDLSGRELILSKILAVAVDVLEADRGTIFFYDDANDELYARHAEGHGGHELRMDANLGLVGAAFHGSQVINVADAYQDPRFHPALDWQAGYRTRSMLCAPIFGNDGKRVGVVQLLNKRTGVFVAADERRLRGLASQMGVTIDYAALFEQTLNMQSYNESMLSSLSNGVVTVDLAGVVTFSNQAAARILRLSDEASTGTKISDLFGGLNAWMATAVEEVGKSGVERSLPNSEFYIEPEDAWVATNITLIPLIDGKHTLLGTMIVIEDMQREKEFRRTMSRYLSNEVIDRLMDDPRGALGGSSHDVTILFSDIRRFTTMTERLGASETVAMLNEYFSFMEDVVTNRSGLIDKYIGDAVMALFGSPFPSPNDPANAVQAAIDMFQALRILNARRRAEQKAEIRIGVGVGTGTAILGNIGSPKRMDFTVIGDSVNLASRIEGATKTYGADLLVCGTTWARLPTRPRARRLDVVRLRGQSRPTDLWEIVEHRSDLSAAALETYGAALDAYLAGRWGQSLRLFQDAAGLRPGDKAAMIMAERSHLFLARPPSRWDGAVDLA